MTPFDPAQAAREAYARLFGQQTRPINGHKILRDLAEGAYAAGVAAERARYAAEVDAILLVREEAERTPEGQDAVRAARDEIEATLREPTP